MPVKIAASDGTVSVKVASEILKVEYRTFKNWLDSGLVKPTKIVKGGRFGRLRRFSLASLNEIKERIIYDSDSQNETRTQ